MQCLQISNNAKKTSSYSFLNYTILMLTLRKSSEINIWWKKMCLGMLSTSLSHCRWVTLWYSWRKNSSSSASFHGLWPSIFLLITFQSFFYGIQVSKLGWPWQGPDLVILHPHLYWPGCVAWSIALLEKTLLRVGEHCQSKRKQVFLPGQRCTLPGWGL